MANHLENCIQCKLLDHWIEIRLVDEHGKPLKGMLRGTLKDNCGYTYDVVFHDGYLLQMGLSAGPVQIKLMTDELLMSVFAYSPRKIEEENPVPRAAEKESGYKKSIIKYQSVTVGDIWASQPKKKISEKNQPGATGKKLVLIVDNSYMLEVKAICKKENIIVIGSEVHENGFFTHLMFIAAAVNKIKSGLRTADNNVIAIIVNGYTKLEIGILEEYRNKQNLELVIIENINQLIHLINRGRENVKIQDLYFYTHGYPGVIDLNMDGSPDIKVNIDTLSVLNKDSFMYNGVIHSFACRTGMGDSLYLLEKNKFSNDKEAEPLKSFAIQMAKYFNVEVNAFLTRTLYRFVIRDPSNDSLIESELKQKRNKEGDNKVYSILGKYEGLPHPGISDGMLSFKARGAGVDGYALWPKQGGLVQPVSAGDVTGLSKGVHVFTPKGEFI